MRRHRGGFTLVELLVVIGIILALMGILLPSVNKMIVSSQRARGQLDLQAVMTALEGYRQDHRDFPRFYPASPTNRDDPEYQGSQILTLALIAPRPRVTSGSILADGQEGPGFRIAPPVKEGAEEVNQGKAYGPYLPPEKFRWDETNFTLFDRHGGPILYFPANKAANINAPPVGTPVTPPRTAHPRGFVWRAKYGPMTTSAIEERPRYNYSDSEAAAKAHTAGATMEAFCRMMGDSNANGRIDIGETPKYTGDVVLWSAGPDGTLFDKDDVANFELGQY